MFDTEHLEDSSSVEMNDIFCLAEDRYPILLSSCSVRAQHVLKAYQILFSSAIDFYKSLLEITPDEAKRFRNCGKQTVEEIMDLSLKLRQITGYDGDSVEIIPTILLSDDIDKVLPLILEKTNKLTVRAKNAICSFIKAQNNSVKQIYQVITAPGFSASKLKNIGKNTTCEVAKFFDEVKSLVERFDNHTTESLNNISFAHNLEVLSIPREYQGKICSLAEQLGYFPIFAVISTYINQFDNEKKTILEGCIRVYNGQNILDKRDIAEKLGISAERVRQKRNGIIENLAAYFSGIRKSGFVSENHYSYIMTHPEDYVNSTEDTDFTPNFVRWVLGATFEEVTMVGDIFKPLTYVYNDKMFVNIVPTELCQYYDFNAYVAALDEKLAEKRTDEERVNLKSFMLPFFKVKYYEDQEKEIETACRSILYLTYELEVDMGQIIFKPNKRKNNPDIIEDILRAAGHPMTLDEIFDEFSFQYPERSTTITSLRGSVISNPNIIPIGRSSTYTLSEWNGEGNKGGTIRSIAIEYLNSSPSGIALFSEVAEYIVKYRPATNESNIYDNLCLEKTGTFKFYFLHGERYLGLGGRKYPIEYFPLESESKSAMNMSIKYPMLIDFIEANGRFPFSSGVDEEEIALHHFWSKQEKLFKEGKIEHHSQLYLQRIQEQYGQLKFEKKEFEWKQTFKQIIDHVEIEGYETLPLPDKEWVKKNCREYRYFREKMPSWKVELIEKYLLID